MSKDWDKITVKYARKVLNMFQIKLKVSKKLFSLGFFFRLDFYSTAI